MLDVEALELAILKISRNLITRKGNECTFNNHFQEIAKSKQFSEIMLQIKQWSWLVLIDSFDFVFNFQYFLTQVIHIWIFLRMIKYYEKYAFAH